MSPQESPYALKSSENGPRANDYPGFVVRRGSTATTLLAAFLVLQAVLLGTWFFREKIELDYRWWYVAEAVLTSVMLTLVAWWITHTKSRTDGEVQELQDQLEKEQGADEQHELIGRALEEHRQRIRSTIEALNKLSPERVALGGTRQELELQSRVQLLDATTSLRSFIHRHQQLGVQEGTPLAYEVGAELGQLRQTLNYVQGWIKLFTPAGWEGQPEAGLSKLVELQSDIAELFRQADGGEETSNWTTESIAARLSTLEFKIFRAYADLLIRSDVPEELGARYSRGYDECIQVFAEVRQAAANATAPLDANLWLAYYRAALVRISETLNRVRVAVNRAIRVQPILGGASSLFSTLSELINTALDLLGKLPPVDEYQNLWEARSNILARAVANTKATIVLTKRSGSEQEHNGRWAFQFSIKVTISVSLVFCLSWFSPWKLLSQTSQGPCCPEVNVHYPPAPVVSDTCCTGVSIKVGKLFDYLNKFEFKPKVKVPIDLTFGGDKPKPPQACSKSDLCKSIEDLNARLDSVLRATRPATGVAQ
jgi:hypothetical protein